MVSNEPEPAPLKYRKPFAPYLLTCFRQEPITWQNKNIELGIPTLWIKYVVDGRYHRVSLILGKILKHIASF